MDTSWQLICDSGSTKATWCLVSGAKKKTIRTPGISPYFLTEAQIETLIATRLIPRLRLPVSAIGEVHYYGTGLGDPQNAKLLKKILRAAFPSGRLSVDHDLTGAARALAGHEKGIACILGTGSSSGYYNGRRLAASHPGLGFILGDEGSGAQLGKKLVQYYLYGTLDDTLSGAFDQAYQTTRAEILNRVYHQPYPNRYLASFSRFLSAHRGHFMVENILEDSLNEFFFRHLTSYPKARNCPVHFTGGVAWAFRDVVRELTGRYDLIPGVIRKAPIDGLVAYHRHPGDAGKAKI